MKYLGIDYGKKKIGLAVSEGELATAWKVIAVAGLEDALKKIIKIIAEEKIKTVVVGRPESGESFKIMDMFFNRLVKDLINGISVLGGGRIEVIEHPETLTTQNAKQQMIDANISRKGRQKEDAYAAAIILQDYLDTLSSC